MNRANRRKPSTHPRATRQLRGGKMAFDSCKQAVDLIGRYLFSNLQRRELLAFENHLASCPDCVAFVKTYKATIDLTRKFLTRQRQNNATSELFFLPPRKRAKRL